MHRLVDPNKYHPVTIADTEFQMRSMSWREKIATVEKINKLEATVASFDELHKTLVDVLHSIDGNTDVGSILNQYESFDDLMEVVSSVVQYCSLTDDESKNSSSSSDSSTPTPAGN